MYRSTSGDRPKVADVEIVDVNVRNNSVAVLPNFRVSDSRTLRGHNLLQIVIPLPHSWRNAGNLLKCSRKMALIDKPRHNGNLRQ
jgi:hypothetical protein